MADSPSPSIKDNPFKRLDALRTKVSGVKSPAPAAAAPADGQAWPRAGVGHSGGEGNECGRPADDKRPRKEEGLHVLESPVADGRAEAEDLQAAEEALEYRH